MANCNPLTGVEGFTDALHMRSDSQSSQRVLIALLDRAGCDTPQHTLLDRASCLYEMGHTHTVPHTQTHTHPLH